MRIGIPIAQEIYWKTLLLSKLVKGEVLYLYLVVSLDAISVAFIQEDEKVQWPIYNISKRLLDAKTRYGELEKLAYALVMASRKLRLYFQAHSIEVPTNFSLRQVLQEPEASGRILKWTIKLS